jgi:hypothetical protein
MIMPAASLLLHALVRPYGVLSSTQSRGPCATANDTLHRGRVCGVAPPAARLVPGS